MSRSPKRVSGILVEAAGDEWVAYVQSSNTAHALNSSAGALFNAVDGVRSIEALAAFLDVDVDVVDLGLGELVEAGLVIVEGEVGSSSRRDLLRKIGIGSAAAAALPIVETIVAPSRAAAASLPPRTHPPTDFPTPSPTPSYTPSPTPEPTYAPTPQPGVVCTGITSQHTGWTDQGAPIFQVTVSGSGDGPTCMDVLLSDNSFAAQREFPGFGVTDTVRFYPASGALQNASVGESVATTVRVWGGPNGEALCPNVTFTITIAPPVSP